MVGKGGVMEMTFPHTALSQDSVDRKNDYVAMLAMASARQANSRTVRIVRRAASGMDAGGDFITRRINFFATKDRAKVAVCGAFAQKIKAEPICEADVYQSDSAYIKDHRLEDEATGVQLTHAGHGVSRTL